MSQVKLVRDVTNHLTLLAAKNSILNSPDVIQQFVSILKGETVAENDKKSPVKQALLHSYIMRGFDNMLQALQSKYIEFLASSSLSKELLSCILKGASASL